MTILSAYYRTPPQVVPLLPECDYSEYNLMPTGHADTDRLWVLTHDWQCLLQTEIGWLEYYAKMGWWLDWASIPGAAECLEKRDDRQGLIAATLHDMMYAFQYPFFDTANAIFRDVMRLEGTGAFRRWYKWAAVQSPAGWKAWEKSSDPRRVDIERRWITVNEVPHVSPDFHHLLQEKRLG